METEQFIKLYNDPKLTVFDIRQIMGLNKHQYGKLRKKTGVANRTTNYSRSKHYNRLPNGKYSIRKMINGKHHFLGVYNTEKDRDRVLEICEEYNWDLSNPKIKDAIDCYRVKSKNYCKINDRYVVYKFINGKKIYYDSFKTESDAKKCTKFLNKIDWNKTVYDQLKINAQGSRQ